MPGCKTSGMITGPTHPHRHRFAVEAIESESRLFQLEPQWRELWSSLADATPFQSPDWILPWWQHYNEGKLLCFAFWNRGKLAGMAPLYIHKDLADGVRRVLLVGTGNSDYLDVLFQAESRIDYLGTLIHSLGALADRWDECNFQQLRPTSALLERTGHLDGLRIEQQPHGVCPRLNLTSPDSTASMLKKVRYYHRRLARNHPFTIAQGTSANAQQILAQLAYLHGRRWQAKGSSGVLSERDRSFHRAVVERFRSTSMLKLYALETKARTLAAAYAFSHRKHFYLYLSGFDPEFSTLSVGTVLLAHTIEEARRQGSRTFDFLRGREEYKYRWGAHDEPTFTKIIRKTSPCA